MVEDTPRICMPIYIDTHEGTDLPTGLRKQVVDRVHSGAADPYGVVDRGLIIDRDANRMHCVLEAPDVEAIVQHHAALKVPLDDAQIHEAEVILKD